MVDDVLKYKRLDGVQEALERCAPSCSRTAARRARSSSTPTPGRCSSSGARTTRSSPPTTPTRPARAEIHLLPGAGHSPHMEAAGDFNRLLEGFLAGVRAG